jgi:hypothetical protein
VVTVRDRATHRRLCVVCACKCVRCAGLHVVCAGRSANVPVRLGTIYRGFACGVDIISSCRTKLRLSVSWPWVFDIQVGDHCIFVNRLIIVFLDLHLQCSEVVSICKN